MANRRMVSNKICIDEKLNQLSVKDRWLWISILVNLDEYGRFSGNIYEIKMVCVPADNEYTTHSIRKSIYKFVELGLVKWEENVVTEFPNFEKYQTFNHRRKNSEYPTLTKKPTKPKPTLKATKEFDEFWQEFPKGRKFNKIKMGQTLQTALDSGVSFDTIIKSLRTQKKNWAMLEPHLIPHMSTWLNQCRWEMEEKVDIVKTDFRSKDVICSECKYSYKQLPTNDKNKDAICPKCGEHTIMSVIDYQLIRGANA